MLVVLLGAALVVPSVQFVHRIRQVDSSPFRAGGERHRTALGRWLPDAEALTRVHEGANPYGPGHWFPTPPFVLLTLVPLAKIGYVPAGVVWAILKVGGFLIGMTLLIRAAGPPPLSSVAESESRRLLAGATPKQPVGVHGIPIGVLVMTAAFSFRPIVSDLQHGNLNIFMMVWLALAWAMYVRGRDVPAGLFLALAIVTKITPALALVYFAYKRAWRVMLGAGVGLALVFFLVPGAVLGFGKNLELLRSWYSMLVAPFAQEGYAAMEIANQSLYGVILRVLSNAGWLAVEPMSTSQALLVGMEDMVRPVTLAGRMIRPAIVLPMIAVMAWCCRAPARDRRDPRSWLEFALVLVAMLLLSERTWKHHATTLPIVYLAVWHVLTCRPWPQRFRSLCVASLVVQWLLLVAAGEGVLGEDLADQMLDGGAFCWGLLLCFIQIAVTLRALRRHSGRPGAFEQSERRVPTT